MNCPFDSNFTIAYNATYEQFNASLAENVTCPGFLLGSDPAGAWTPWFCSLLLLLLRLSACVFRAARWKAAQTLSLALAVCSIALCIQTYVSWFYNESHHVMDILVWMPLVFFLDVGAVLRMTLLRNRTTPSGRSFRRTLVHAVIRGWKLVGARLTSRGTKYDKNAPLKVDGKCYCSQFENGCKHCAPPVATACSRNSSDDELSTAAQAKNMALRPAIFAIVVAMLCLTPVLSLIFGLIYTFTGRSQEVSWCSPSFGDFVLAITTTTCEKYEIIGSSSDGIGCVDLTAFQQLRWLQSTIVLLITSSLLENTYVVLRKVASMKTKTFPVVRSQRLWLTMFGGILVLIGPLFWVILNSAQVPANLTDVIWIYRVESGAIVGSVCQAKRSVVGLRASSIAYLDGILESWTPRYYGSSSIRSVASVELAKSSNWRLFKDFVRVKFWKVRKL